MIRFLKFSSIIMLSTATLAMEVRQNERTSFVSQEDHPTTTKLLNLLNEKGIDTFQEGTWDRDEILKGIDLIKSLITFKWRDAEGHTFYHLFSKMGSLGGEFISRLRNREFEFGFASVNIKNTKEFSPLHIAALAGNRFAVKALLEAEEPQMRGQPALANVMTSKGFSVLDAALNFLEGALEENIKENITDGEMSLYLILAAIEREKNNAESQGNSGSGQDLSSQPLATRRVLHLKNVLGNLSESKEKLHQYLNERFQYWLLKEAENKQKQIEQQQIESAQLKALEEEQQRNRRARSTQNRLIFK